MLHLFWPIWYPHQLFRSLEISLFHIFFAIFVHYYCPRWKLLAEFVAQWIGEQNRCIIVKGYDFESASCEIKTRDFNWIFCGIYTPIQSSTADLPFDWFGNSHQLNLLLILLSKSAKSKSSQAGGQLYSDFPLVKKVGSLKKSYLKNQDYISTVSQEHYILQHKLTHSQHSCAWSRSPPQPAPAAGPSFSPPGSDAFVQDLGSVFRRAQEVAPSPHHRPERPRHLVCPTSCQLAWQVHQD